MFNKPFDMFADYVGANGGRDRDVPHCQSKLKYYVQECKKKVGFNMSLKWMYYVLIFMYLMLTGTGFIFCQLHIMLD